MAKDEKPKMGRPATGITPKRYFRLDDEAWAEIERAAADRGKTISEFVRETLLRAAKRTPKA